MSILKSFGAFLAAAALSLSMGVGYAYGASLGDDPAHGAPVQDLPDLGSPANAAISLEDEYQAGLSYANQIRETGIIINDPEISQYAQEFGHSLSSHADEGKHQFYYFVVREPEVNAAAIPGGFVVINSGLILATRNENEFAAVLAHETAHVTQRHIVRGILDQSHQGLITTAAMLAAILLGAAGGRNGRGNPDAIEGAILGAQSAAIQHQINYTRDNEFEADRIGIGTMAAAGYDPLGMASFFDFMSHLGPDPAFINAVQFLIDHPIPSDRVAEARDRADQIGRIHHDDSLTYLLMRERLRSVAGEPKAALDHYNGLIRNGGGKDVQERYGRDIALINVKTPTLAIPDLQALVKEYPKVTPYYGALGQAYLAAGQLKESQAVLLQAMNLFPRNVPVTIRYAETLMKSGDNKQAHLLLLDLFNVVEPTADQTRLIAKAAKDAGDIADSDAYMAEFYLMTGDLDKAYMQLQMALTTQGLDPIQRARISARLEQVHAAMPKTRKVADDRGR
jgi:predicted Zn-dependent protease